MKNTLKNIGLFLLNILRRILFILLSLVLWPVYIATTLVFVPLEYFVLLFILPILWVFLGSENINKIGNALFKRSNKELWHTDYVTEYDKDGSFVSFVPVWGLYVQENWLNKLIPEDIENE